jgi:hypothetical protein
MKVPIWNLILSRKRKLTLWALGLLLAYAIIGFFILPPIVRSVAVKQLSKQLDRDVSIQKIKINPFVLSATVDGLLIKDKDGQPFVSWDEVYVNFQLSSFFGHAWVFKEISTTKPFIRAQMNWDRTFNFSDLIAKFSTSDTNAASQKPSSPLALHIGRLRIGGAAAAFSDLTMRTPFTRVVGPLDVTLENFRTDPDNKNPYSFAGTTDAGETFSWSGFFSLDPLRSQGELSLDRITLNKYAALYQDFVRFEIRDGSIGLHANYDFELNATNRVITITNTSFALRDFKLGEPGASNNIIELPVFGANGVSVDLESHQAEIGSVFMHGGKFFLNRDKNNSINVVELSRPAETNASVPGGILFLLRSVTNAVAALLNSTNQWSGTIHDVDLTNCAVHLEDFVNSRPATLDLDNIALSAKNISNIPATNLTASLSLRWNTNGTINTEVAASFSPPTADIQLALTNLDLGTLDPYLEPKLNLLILESKLGLTGFVHLGTPKDELPQVTFYGGARLDNLHTADGALGEDLLKWDSLRFNDINANLNPPTVSIREIDLDNAYARVVIETNHAINLLAALQPANTNAVVETNSTAVAKNNFAPGETNSSSPPKISIGSIVVSNAQFNFSDYSVTPNVNLAIQQAGGTVDGISSEELEHADLDLHARVDGVGPVDITGTINPFSGTQTNEIKISAKDVDLTPTSPYAGKFAGYRIARGKLNLDLEYEIIGKKLSAKNVITLDQFTFGEKVDSTNATHLPVRLAVAILKDREGKIILDVPIAGNLDDPQLRIGKVVTRAIMNILEKVATSPFSLLGAVFGGGGEELSYEDFAPGSAELSPASTNKLESLVKGLYARPALQLEISGSIDPASDRDGLQRVALEKQLHTYKWQLLGKSQRATTTPGQIILTPGERTSLVHKFFSEAETAGKITPALIAANTNLTAAIAQLTARKASDKKAATLLMKTAPASAPKSSGTAAAPAQSKLAPPADPMEALLLATFPISDGDLEMLAADRAKAVRAYILSTGKVEAARLFLTENQTGGVRSDGSRVYLQFQ